MHQHSANTDHLCGMDDAARSILKKRPTEPPALLCFVYC